jgi:hypothetical protein
MVDRHPGLDRSREFRSLGLRAHRRRRVGAPVLAVTSLAYVAAGTAVLSWAVRVRGPLAGAAEVALVAVGAGSFAYHGPRPS